MRTIMPGKTLMVMAKVTKTEKASGAILGRGEGGRGEGGRGEIWWGGGGNRG